MKKLTLLLIALAISSTQSMAGASSDAFERCIGVAAYFYAPDSDPNEVIKENCSLEALNWLWDCQMDLVNHGKRAEAANLSCARAQLATAHKIMMQTRWF